MQEYPEEIQYTCKKDKVSQAERIQECKYKTTIIELEKLKNKYKEMEKRKRDVERKFASIKKVWKQTNTKSERTRKTQTENLPV